MYVIIICHSTQEIIYEEFVNEYINISSVANKIYEKKKTNRIFDKWKNLFPVTSY